MNEEKMTKEELFGILYEFDAHIDMLKKLIGEFDRGTLNEREARALNAYEMLLYCLSGTMFAIDKNFELE